MENKKLEELIADIESAKDLLADFNKLKHLFSDDDAEKRMAKLRQTLGRIGIQVKAQKIKEVKFPKNEPFQEKGFTSQIGDLVSVRPCGIEYEGKSYFGIMLGDYALGASMTIEDDAIQLSYAHYNPAMYVPEINKIIYGAGSWWGKIEKEEDLKDISDKDIENCWYVKLLKNQLEKENGN